ncbi:MAG: hypothetical protein ACREPL_16045, partial [Rhodanobacteraceae bacterium]
MNAKDAKGASVEAAVVESQAKDGRSGAAELEPLDPPCLSTKRRSGMIAKVNPNKKPDGVSRPVRVAPQEGGDLRRASFSIPAEGTFFDPSRDQRAFFAGAAAASLAAFRLLRVISPSCS